MNENLAYSWTTSIYYLYFSFLPLRIYNSRQSKNKTKTLHQTIIKLNIFKADSESVHTPFQKMFISENIERNSRNENFHKNENWAIGPELSKNKNPYPKINFTPCLGIVASYSGLCHPGKWKVSSQVNPLQLFLNRKNNLSTDNLAEKDVNTVVWKPDENFCVKWDLPCGSSTEWGRKLLWKMFLGSMSNKVCFINKNIPSFQWHETSSSLSG